MTAAAHGKSPSARAQKKKPSTVAGKVSSLFCGLIWSQAQNEKRNVAFDRWIAEVAVGATPPAIASKLLLRLLGRLLGRLLRRLLSGFLHCHGAFTSFLIFQM
jgi:hypothetical protein